MKVLKFKYICLLVALGIAWDATQGLMHAWQVSYH